MQSPGDPASKKLQPHVVQEVHRDHQGAAKMKVMARSYVWWSGLTTCKDLEEMAKSCSSNSLASSKQQIPHRYPAREATDQIQWVYWWYEPRDILGIFLY